MGSLVSIDDYPKTKVDSTQFQGVKRKKDNANIENDDISDVELCDSDIEVLATDKVPDFKKIKIDHDQSKVVDSPTIGECGTAQAHRKHKIKENNFMIFERIITLSN